MSRTGARVAAALVALLAYGIGLGWTIGGDRCASCQQARPSAV